MTKYWREITILILIFLLCLTQCEGEKTVSTPEIKGTLIDTIHDVVYQDVKVPVKGKTVYKNIVQQLIVRDTIKGDTIYKPIDTLKTQAFNKSFEDSRLKINANGTVTGRIEDLKLDYLIKSQKINVSDIKMKISGGIELGIDRQFTKSICKGTVFFEGKKGAWSISGDNQKNIYIGKTVKLLSF